MESIEIYQDKGKIILLFLVCLFFSVISIIFYKDIFEEKSIVKQIALILGLILFVFGTIHSAIQLQYDKPILIIKKDSFIFNHILRKPTEIHFSEVKSFNVWTHSYRGITSTRQLVIEMKKKRGNYDKSLFYKSLKKISKKSANQQYGFIISNLDKNHQEILSIMNKRLKEYNKNQPSKI